MDKVMKYASHICAVTMLVVMMIFSLIRIQKGEVLNGIAGVVCVSVAAYLWINLTKPIKK